MSTRISVGFPFCSNCECRRFFKRNAELSSIIERLKEMGCSLDDLVCVVNENGVNQQRELKIIRQSLTTDLPIVAKVEYPEESDGMIIYKWIGFTFRDYVLGPLNIYFSGRINSTLPVFIQDASGFNHTVTAPGSEDQLMGVSTALVNKLLPATYEGNYIHLT